MSNVYEKLNEARERVHSAGLKKTGTMHNSRNGYFELADFIQPALAAFKDVGLCGVVSFPTGRAMLTITDATDPTQQIIIESEFGSAALKGCHEVQNIGAVQTYQRRYLWMAALEIVEGDALDSAIGRGEAPEPPKEPTITEDQVTELMAHLDAMNVPPAKFLAVSKIDKLDQLTVDRFDNAKNWITKNAKQKDEA